MGVTTPCSRPYLVVSVPSAGLSNAYKAKTYCSWFKTKNPCTKFNQGALPHSFCTSSRPMWLRWHGPYIIFESIRFSTYSSPFRRAVDVHVTPLWCISYCNDFRCGSRSAVNSQPRRCINLPFIEPFFALRYVIWILTPTRDVTATCNHAHLGPVLQAALFLHGCSPSSVRHYQNVIDLLP